VQPGESDDLATWVEIELSRWRLGSPAAQQAEEYPAGPARSTPGSRFG
jgi:hypothetical protein